MKNICFVIGVLFLFSLPAYGQTSKSDIEQLRREVGLPSPVSILKKKAAFPASKPTKIFLAIKHNHGIERDFMDWVAKWNRTQADQYGELQLVTDIEDADIAAVQYQKGTGAPLGEETVRTKIGNVSIGDGDRDDIILNRKGNAGVRAQSGVRFLRRPLYSYLIARGENGAWHLYYSRVDESNSSETPFPESLLRSAIESRLKNR